MASGYQWNASGSPAHLQITEDDCRIRLFSAQADANNVIMKQEQGLWLAMEFAKVR